ncbi:MULTISPECIES: hypothetical protein [unclassified Frankia]|uniref:hypothetical protein n=1 Tax=unclassified Frankia TaxID=2632575 RepID=UPI002AD2A398|nr:MULTISPECIES: hypothetical protein [unclassified Frankia]
MTDVELMFAGDLVSEVRRLHDRIQGWTPGSWRQRSASVGTRADRVRALAAELADLGHQAGSGAPAGVRPPSLADHALADQIVVLATDLVETLLADTRGHVVNGCSDRRRDIAERARSAVRAARLDLEGRRL